MNSEPKYRIGDAIWWATWESSETYITCPDCGGTARIRCILFDETEVSIGCEGCSRGHEAPTGRIQVYTRQALAKPTAVRGFEVSADGVEYHLDGGWRIPEADLFDAEQEALTAAAAKAEEQDRAERAKVNAKEKPTKSWAWNVHYHRSCIRRAEKDIAYHTARLNAAKVKARADVQEKSA